jgi:hypothetical protein
MSIYTTPRYGIKFLARGINLPLLQNFKIFSGFPSASYSSVTGGSFVEVKAAGT